MASVGTIKYQSGDEWIDILHPVGSFYFSTSNTSPANLFGGQWTQITAAVLRGNTSIGYTSSDSRTLSWEQMPKHYHGFTAPGGLVYDKGHWGTDQPQMPGAAMVSAPGGAFSTPFATSNNAWLGQSSYAGTTSAISFIPRSYNCYMWYRTA